MLVAILITWPTVSIAYWTLIIEAVLSSLSCDAMSHYLGIQSIHVQAGALSVMVSYAYKYFMTVNHVCRKPQSCTCTVPLENENKKGTFYVFVLLSYLFFDCQKRPYTLQSRCLRYPRCVAIVMAYLLIFLIVTDALVLPEVLVSRCRHYCRWRLMITITVGVLLTALAVAAVDVAWLLLLLVVVV